MNWCRFRNRCVGAVLGAVGGLVLLATAGVGAVWFDDFDGNRLTRTQGALLGVIVCGSVFPVPAIFAGGAIGATLARGIRGVRLGGMILVIAVLACSLALARRSFWTVRW